MVFTILTTLFTMRHSTGETLFLEMFKAAIVIGELSVKIIDRVAQVHRNRLSGFHGRNSMPFVLRAVKG